MSLEDVGFISDWEDTEDPKTKISYAFPSESLTAIACCSASCNAMASVLCVLFFSGIKEGD